MKTKKILATLAVVVTLGLALTAGGCENTRSGDGTGMGTSNNQSR